MKMKRTLSFCLTMAIVAAVACFPPTHAIRPAFAASAPAVSLSVQNAAPRAVEDTTQKAVVRDYATAWQAMIDALDQNRADLLAANFVGNASDTLTATIEEQRKSGLHQRIVDKGHTVEAVFYSPEGSAMEMHDTAQFQIQLLDGTNVIHSEDATVHYVALLTAAENSWKVRVLQAVPAF
jgi:cobalamin biosynthesis protein CobT